MSPILRAIVAIVLSVMCFSVLNAMSNFWMARLGHVIPNHLTGRTPESVVKGADVTSTQIGG